MPPAFRLLRHAGVCSRNDEVELLMIQALVIYQTSVNYSFHLCAYRIKIDWRGKHDHIRSFEFLEHFFHIILNSAGMRFHAGITGMAGGNVHLPKQEHSTSCPASKAPFAKRSHSTSEFPAVRRLELMIKILILRLLVLFSCTYYRKIGFLNQFDFRG